MNKLLVALSALAFCALMPATSALAGPNAGGTLVLHQVDLAFTGECGLGAPSECSQADTRIDGHDTAAWKLYAAFPVGSAPRLMGITFGISYDPGIVLTAWGMCGDFELPDEHWPSSGEGDAVTWNLTQLGLLTEVYWFQGYNTDGSLLFRTINHPVGGGYFGDDAIPARLDPIAGYSGMGFDRPGVLVCPGPAQPGACCEPEGCQMLLPADCPGAFYGGSCNPDPCSGWGACCIDDVCHYDFAYSCAQMDGQFMGQGIPCDPDPCNPTPVEFFSWGRIKSLYRP